MESHHLVTLINFKIENLAGLALKMLQDESMLLEMRGKGVASEYFSLDDSEIALLDGKSLRVVNS